ncbi:MAG TPA: XdhC family protein [Pirellulales bacterium]|jgi:xanthine dehydrogenase accessory factor|nr:XdhC family protein [Pirellulales bacterium]
MTTHRLNTEPIQAVVEFIDSGRAFALAVVLRGTGSTPRKAGTKAIIDSTGSIWGTIGGGLLESEAQRVALEAMQSRRPVVFDFKFTGASACGDDPVCGGSMRILIDPTTADYRATYAMAAEALRRRERGVLVTTVIADAGRVSVQWLGRSDAPLDADSVASEAVALALARGEPQYFVEGLAEPLTPTPLLIISGGGHVGQALAEQARLVGFDVVLVEDRPQFAEAALYPADVATRCGKLTELLDEFPITEDTYIAIVGRGHRVDGEALVACIDKPAAYVGMLGSRRKVALVRKDFIESGKATAEQFDRVHAPIGLEIGAQTVPEIAASIVAQLVAVRRLDRSAAWSRDRAATK